MVTFFPGVCSAQSGMSLTGAVAVCAEVVRLYGDRPDAPTQVLVAGALLQQGIALSALGRPDEALLAYDELLRRFGDVTGNPDLAEVVATGRQLRGSPPA